MANAKKAVITLVAVAAAAAVGVTGFMLWRKKDSAAKKGTVFVQSVSDLNTANGFTLSGSKFSGVVETQKTEDVKYDTSKTIAEFYVKVGDEVKADQKLFCYDVEAMQLEYDQAKIEIERMENEVETNELQIEQLEKEKTTASKDDQVEITMRILSLQSDNSKTEYDIKTKKNENKKLKESIKNADVLSPIDGIVKNIKDTSNSSSDETMDNGIAVSLSKGDDLQIRASVNEQMIDMVYTDMPVILRSRIDANDTWSGTVIAIETKPQSSSQDNMYYYDGEEDSTATSSKYSFYILPDSFDGLMLGQHLIVEPDEGMMESDIEKEGVWLYSDFVFEENGVSYVWAANEKDRIEKREVKLGKTDEYMGDVEILSGITDKDSIAYPDEQYEEGMSVTKDYEKATVPDNDDENDDEDIDYNYDEDEYFDDFDEDYDEDDYDGFDEYIEDNEDEYADVIGEED